MQNRKHIPVVRTVNHDKEKTTNMTNIRTVLQIKITFVYNGQNTYKNIPENRTAL